MKGLRTDKTKSKVSFSRNEQIKFNLISSLQKSISEMKTQSASLIQSKGVAKAYSAILLSIVNYGYNVANRRIAPSAEFREKESAIAPRSLNEEQRYIRSEPDHPARGVYQLLITALNDKCYLNKSEANLRKMGLNPDEVKKNNAKIGRLQNYLHDMLDFKKQQKTHQSWLGQWKSPEEVFEYVFSQLSADEIIIVSDFILTSVSKSLIDTHLSSTPTPEKKDSYPDVSHIESDFRSMMKKRVSIAQAIHNESKSNQLLPFQAAKSGYPCITFDIRNLAKACKVKFSEHDNPTKTFERFNKLIICYFCGLINYFSMQHYGPNFVWTQTQGSFGSLRPSLTDTGLSFRLSPGLIPNDFNQIIWTAYEFLLNSIENSDESFLNSLLETADDFFTFHWCNEDAQLYALHSVAENSENSNKVFASYVDRLIPFQKRSNPIKIRQNRDEIFSLAKKIIITKDDGEYKQAKAPDELLGLRDKLVSLSQELKPSKDFSLAEFESSLHAQIRDITTSATGSDYSKVCSDVEILTRLMKITYELNKLRSREHRAKSKSQNGLSGLTLPTLKRQESVDSLDSSLSENTFATRCCMSAFVIAYRAIHDGYLGSKRIASADEIYFELPSDIYSYVAKAIKLGSKALFKSVTDLTGSVHFVDMAQFPTKPHGESTETPWKKNWSKIKAEDRPEILVVDLTAATQEDLELVASEADKNPNEKPYIIITFASDNKYGQMGVDLVCMGELRLFCKDVSEPKIKSEINDLHKHLQAQFTITQENTTSAKAMRALAKKSLNRRSLNNLDHKLEEKSLHQLKHDVLEDIESLPGLSNGLLEVDLEIQESSMESISQAEEKKDDQAEPVKEISSEVETGNDIYHQRQKECYSKIMRIWGIYQHEKNDHPAQERAGIEHQFKTIFEGLREIDQEIESIAKTCS